MKIEVVEIGYGRCKDLEGMTYIGIDNGMVMNEETGEIYQISKRDENGNVVEIAS